MAESLESSISFVENTLGVNLVPESAYEADQIAGLVTSVDAGLSSDASSGWRVAGQTIYFDEHRYRDLALSDVSLRGTAQTAAVQDLISAALMYDVWTVYRLPKQSPARIFKRRSIELARPDLSLLFQTVDRLETVGDLLRAFPNYRSDLLAMFLHRVTGGASSSQNLRKRKRADLTNLTFTEQWLLAVLFEVVGGSTLLKLAPEVQAELEQLTDPTKNGFGVNALARTISPIAAQANTRTADRNLASSQRSDTRRLERIVTLILPGYERLVLQMQVKSGLATGVTGDGPEAETSEQIDFGSGLTDALGESDDDKNAHDSEDNLEERASDEADIAEGADLFEATSAAPVTSLLESPISTTSPQMLEMLQEFIEEQQQDNADQTAGEFSAEIKITKAQYRNRAHLLAPQIRKMLEVWRSNIAKEQNLKYKLAQQLQPEGEVLDEARLPEIVAEALAGVSRPDAFRPRQRDVQPKLNLASTDYVMVIDRSSSMRAVAQHAADAALVLAESLAAFMREIDQLNVTDQGTSVEIRTAIIMFDSVAEVIKPLGSAVNTEARIALYSKAQHARGATNDAAALSAAEAQLGLSEGGVDGAPKRNHSAKRQALKRRRIVMVIGDGDSSDRQLADAMIERLRAKDVEVWGIGVGDNAMIHRYSPTGLRVDRGNQIVSAVKEIIESVNAK